MVQVIDTPYKGNRVIHTIQANQARRCAAGTSTASLIWALYCEQDMRYIFLVLISFSQSTIACLCNNEVVFHTGAKAIEAKYPEYKITREEYEVVELKEKWMVLRKEFVYEEQPKEYPRAFISKEGCKLERIFWSK